MTRDEKAQPKNSTFGLVEVYHVRARDLLTLVWGVEASWHVFPLLFKVQENATEQNAMPAVRRLNVELTKEKLDTMLDGLGKIRDQLSSVSK